MIMINDNTGRDITERCGSQFWNDIYERTLDRKMVKVYLPGEMLFNLISVQSEQTFRQSVSGLTEYSAHFMSIWRLKWKLI